MVCVAAAGTGAHTENSPGLLMTDAEIREKSSKTKPRRRRKQHRELQRASCWLEGGDGSHFASLSSESALEWDQFAANNDLFGVRSESFDKNFESIYTTTLDRDAFTSEQVEAAAQLANQIHKSASSCKNIHVAEERGLVLPSDRDGDEEGRFSAVCHPQEPANASASDLVRQMLGISHSACLTCDDSSSDTASSTSEAEPEQVASPFNYL